MISNLIVLLTGVVGFLTVFLIILRYKSNRIANIYLVIIFILISIRMVLTGLLSPENEAVLTKILFKYTNGLIFIIPSIYLYFDNLIRDYKKIRLPDYIHFIAPFLFNLVGIFVDNHFFEISNNNYYYYSFAIVYMIIYNVMIFRLLYNKIWKRQGEITVVIKQNQLLKNWSIYLFIIISIVSGRFIIWLFLEIENQSYNFRSNRLWISAICWLILYFKIIISPEILYGYTFLNTKINEYKNTNKQTTGFWIKNPKIEITNVQNYELFEKIKDNLVRYMTEIDQFSFTSKAYRNTSFSLTDLSNRLNIPKSHITFLFKYHSKISFSDYKKIIRIQDGLELIQSGFLNVNTYESLAKETGFKSYNTFFVSFKDVSGLSPQDYFVQYVRNKSI